MVEDLKKLGLWGEDMLEKIKFNDGSIQEIHEIPPAIRDKYKEVFEIDAQWLIKAAAYRGRWIDQSQSLNIFYSGTSGRVLSEMYQYAWSLGLKTTYYLRTMGASRIEKSTVSLAKFGVKDSQDVPAQSIPSSVMIEETVAILRSPDTIVAEAPTPTPKEVAEEVVAAIEVTQVIEGGQTPFPYAGTPQPSPESFPVGIPKFEEREKVTAGKRPKIEILNDGCESCSA